MLVNESLHSSVINNSFKEELKDKTIYNFALSLENPENWDQLLKNFKWDGILYKGIVLDAFHEAPEEWRIKKIVDQLVALGVPKNKILWIDSGFSVSSDIKHISFPIFLNSYITDNTVVTPFSKRSKMFLALARHPKPQRVKFVLELLRLGLDKESVITCGCDRKDFDGWDHYVPIEYRHRFPMMLNSKTVSLQQINTIEEEFKTCVINIVLETSFENIFPDSGWNRYFYTEKTGKAFFLEQVPLFLAKQGYVAVLRNLGFDVFDDIVDHSYDQVEDPEERIQVLAQECQRLSNLGLDHIKNIQGLNERFTHNKQHRRLLANRLDGLAMLELKQWINQL
jgi:hypothetical protein